MKERLMATLQCGEQAPGTGESGRAGVKEDSCKRLRSKKVRRGSPECSPLGKLGDARGECDCFHFCEYR